MSTTFQRGEFQITISGQTDTGLERAHNEDFLHLPEGECLVVVADGMGAHAAGELASVRARFGTMPNFSSSAPNNCLAFGVAWSGSIAWIRDMMFLLTWDRCF